MPDASQSLQLLLQEGMDSTPVFPTIHMIRTVSPSFFSRTTISLREFLPQDVMVRVVNMHRSRTRFIDQACRLAFHRYVESCLRLVVANCSRYSINLRGGPSSLHLAERPDNLTLVSVDGA